MQGRKEKFYKEIYVARERESKRAESGNEILKPGLFIRRDK